MLLSFDCVDLLLDIAALEVKGLTTESVDLFRFGWTQSSLLGLRKDSKLNRAQVRLNSVCIPRCAIRSAFTSAIANEWVAARIMGVLDQHTFTCANTHS